MIVTFDSKTLIKELNNLTNYSIGFLEGVDAAKEIFIDNFGKSVIESLKNFIDTNARVNPESLHHVYEWYQTGSPEARLFDIEYTVVGKNTLTFNYTFSQSLSYSQNSSQPFYDKANIMENGIPVTIRPKAKSVITFNDNGEQVFTKKPVIISRPGGDAVQGGFERILKSFFESYFTQSYIMISGIKEHFNNPEPYKRNLKSGIKQGGKSLGFRTGFEWTAKGGKIE
ncbi:MAG: hypothetical protein EBT86_06250 [Actinobacteria bacterium]|nr:hypothetical protein [Actinomycetota bacterium]